MIFTYNGYNLEFTSNKYVPELIHGECPEAKFFYIEESYDATIKAFKELIDSMETVPTIEQLLEENKQLKQQIKDMEYEIALAEGRIW